MNGKALIVRKSSKTVAAAIVEVLSFLFFCGAYYLPLVLDLPAGLYADARIAGLLDALVHSPAAQFELGRNLLGHCFLLLGAFWVLSSIEKHLSERFSV